MVVEVSAYVFVQMDAVRTHHVVTVSWIEEQVGVCACINTCAEE
jgi:hypothetical protein